MTKKLKGLNKKEEFSTLVNWIINKLPPFKSMDLRHKVNDELYQTPIQRRAREIRVGKTMLKTSQAGTVSYDWPEQITYETLDVEIITTSAIRANIINAAKMDGKLLSAQEIAEREKLYIGWNLQPKEISTSQSEQEDRNCWDEVLTEQEREILGEFLDV